MLSICFGNERLRLLTETITVEHTAESAKTNAKRTYDSNSFRYGSLFFRARVKFFHIIYNLYFCFSKIAFNFYTTGCNYEML